MGDGRGFIALGLDLPTPGRFIWKKKMGPISLKGRILTRKNLAKGRNLGKKMLGKWGKSWQENGYSRQENAWQMVI